MIFAPPTDTPDPSLADEIAALARETAYDRYIHALLMKPKSVRRDFVVLAAFHGELQRIPLLVSEPMMGDIRLQWWHDTLSALDYVSGDPPDLASPLANAVAGLVAGTPKSLPFCLAAIDARRAELYADEFKSREAFVVYLDGVGTSLFQVAALLLRISDGEANLSAVQSAGRAVAAMELAERWRHLAARGRPLVIPNFQLSTDGGATAASDMVSFDDAAEKLSTYARSAVADYCRLQTSVSHHLTDAVLPLALVEPYFRGLQRRGAQHATMHDPLTPLGRVGRLWWVSKRQKLPRPSSAW